MPRTHVNIGNEPYEFEAELPDDGEAINNMRRALLEFATAPASVIREHRVPKTYDGETRFICTNEDCALCDALDTLQELT